jgi:hypothetical protein
LVSDTTPGAGVGGGFCANTAPGIIHIAATHSAAAIRICLYDIMNILLTFLEPANNSEPSYGMTVSIN